MAGILSGSISERIRRRLVAQELAVLATRGPTGHPRVWVVTGPASFLDVPEEHTLRLTAEHPLPEEVRGDLARDDRVALVGLNLTNRERARVNGRALVDAKGSLTVRVDEAFGNCPKYIQTRESRVEREAPPAAEVVSSPTLTARHRAWIERADTFFIASGSADGTLDVSHRGGRPGFVRAQGDGRLIWADYSGNNLMQTLGNLAQDERAGLLFPDFETGVTLHLLGRIRLRWDGPTGSDGATGRLVEFTPERVDIHPPMTPRRWTLLDYSPFAPPVGEGLPDRGGMHDVAGP